MPRNGSVGYSDNTPLKNQHFTIMLQTHMRIVRSLAARYTWIEPVYHYIDLNAGPGCYRVAGEVVYGSPIIACTVADQERLPMSATFCEQDEQSLAALRHSLITFGFHTIQEHPDIFDNQRTVVATLLAGNCLETARDLLTHYLQHTRHPKSHYGLIYSDENGALPPFALLGDYARHLPHLDILIHVAATPIKRQRLSPNHPLSERLDELMATIAKEQWIVRQPYGHHQWSFLIGTNWDAFPRFKRQGFWPVSSPEGARILRILSWTTQERSDHEQQNLFPEERP